MFQPTTVDAKGSFIKRHVSPRTPNFDQPASGRPRKKKNINPSQVANVKAHVSINILHSQAVHRNLKVYVPLANFNHQGSLHGRFSLHQSWIRAYWFHSETWNLNCSRVPGYFNSMSYWILTRISTDLPFIGAKLSFYPHIPWYSQYITIISHEQQAFPSIFPVAPGPPWVPPGFFGPGVSGPRQGSMATTSTSMMTSVHLHGMSEKCWFCPLGKHIFPIKILHSLF